MGKDTYRGLYTKTIVLDRLLLICLVREESLNPLSTFSIAVNFFYKAICPHQKSRFSHD